MINYRDSYEPYSPMLDILDQKAVGDGNRKEGSAVQMGANGWYSRYPCSTIFTA